MHGKARPLFLLLTYSYFFSAKCRWRLLLALLRERSPTHAATPLRTAPGMQRPSCGTCEDGGGSASSMQCEQAAVRAEPGGAAAVEAATEERIDAPACCAASWVASSSAPRTRPGLRDDGHVTCTCDMHMWARMWGGEPFEELTMQDFAATWGLDCAVEVQLFAEVAQYTGGVECF